CAFAGSSGLLLIRTAGLSGTIRVRTADAFGALCGTLRSKGAWGGRGRHTDAASIRWPRPKPAMRFTRHFGWCRRLGWAETRGLSLFSPFTSAMATLMAGISSSVDNSNCHRRPKTPQALSKPLKRHTEWEV